MRRGRKAVVITVCTMAPSAPLLATSIITADIRLVQRRCYTLRLRVGFLVIGYVRRGTSLSNWARHLCRIPSSTFIFFSINASTNLLNRFSILALSKKPF